MRMTLFCGESDIWGIYSPFLNCLQVLSRSVKPEETIRLGKDGSGLVTMISGSSRQWKSLRQKDLSVSWLSDAGILISEIG